MIACCNPKKYPLMQEPLDINGIANASTLNAKAVRGSFNIVIENQSAQKIKNY